MADVELLPLPEPLLVRGDIGGLYTGRECQHYARANLAPLQAENERLRVEVDAGDRNLAAAMSAVAELEARAERLAEALRNIAAMRWSSGEDLMDAAGAARAALEQEDRNG